MDQYTFSLKELGFSLKDIKEIIAWYARKYRQDEFAVRRMEGWAVLLA